MRILYALILVALLLALRLYLIAMLVFIAFAWKEL